MNIIFTGTSEFAAASLEAIIASPQHDLLAVVTQPDRPKGRGREMQITPVKEIALAHSIPILQPEKISDPESIAQIKELGPIGAMIVVAYGQKIPSELLEWPSYGVVNVHGSILPKYRGAAPIQYAIIMGEKQTGVTTMLMDEGWDTGDILLQESIDILPNENAAELSTRLALLGARLLVRTLDGIEMGTINAIPQNDELASAAHSLPRDAGVIDWSLASSDISNLIRGVTPKPGAFTRINGVQVKVWSAVVDKQDDRMGELGEIINIDNDTLCVAAGTGSVKLIELQPESRQRMSAAAFAHGGKLVKGDRFDVRFELEK